MTALLTVADARRLITTALDDTDLAAIIADEEAELIRKCGAHGNGTVEVTDTLTGGGADLFLPRPFVSITSIAEQQSDFGTASTVATSAYLAWGAQGRIRRNGRWGASVSVTYVPIDDQARRRAVLTELVRLALEQTAMKSESVAGEYSYSAPDWEAARARLYRRLTFFEV